MKRVFFKYKRNETLLRLTVILIFCACIIIRGSEFPLIRLNNFVDKYIEMLFLSSSVDRTFYNIGISYVAAYIFYVVQIYIPSVSNHNHGFRLIQSRIESYINNVSKLVLITENLISQDRDRVAIKRDKYCFYIVEESRQEIFRINFLAAYRRLKDQISAELSEIQTSPLLNYLDDNLSELLCMLPIKELFILSDNIYEQVSRSTNAEIIDSGVVRTIQHTIHELQHRYGFTFETFRITDDLNLQSQYIGHLTTMAQYTNDELKIKVKLQKISD